MRQLSNIIAPTSTDEVCAIPRPAGVVFLCACMVLHAYLCVLGHVCLRNCGCVLVFACVDVVWVCVLVHTVCACLFVWTVGHEPDGYPQECNVRFLGTWSMRSYELASQLWARPPSSSPTWVHADLFWLRPEVPQDVGLSVPLFSARHGPARNEEVDSYLSSQPLPGGLAPGEG